MAVTLTDTWNEHAFPDEYPAKEQVWAEEAEHKRNVTRDDMNLELSGSGLKIRRHTGKNQDNGPNSKAAKGGALDAMLLAIGSPAYIEAYNNELSFTINGEKLNITQGELYERAKKRAEDLQEQIDDAKRRGASADEVARMQATRRQIVIVRDNADPRLDLITPDRRAAIDNAIAGNTDVRNMVLGEGAYVGGPAAKQSELLERMDRQAATIEVVNKWGSAAAGTSFAATIDGEPDESTALSLAEEFAQAKTRQTLEPAAPDSQPDVTAPNRTTGMNL